MSSSPTFTPSSLAVAERALVATRRDLHRLAFYVLSASRQAATGRIGLRSTPGGFGTPPFDDTDGTVRVVRVEGRTLVVESDDRVQRAPITTLAAAAELVGITPDGDRGAEFDVPDIGSLDESLTVDPDASVLLAEWYRFGFDALEAMRTQATPEDDATEAQLWPEHFDVGIDMGSAEAGAHAWYRRVTWRRRTPGALPVRRSVVRHRSQRPVLERHPLRRRIPCAVGADRRR